MKISQAAFIATILGFGSSADAKSLRTFAFGTSDQKTKDRAVEPAVEPVEPNNDASDEGRRLSAPNGANGCWGPTAPAAAWHPNYVVGWTDGHCTFTVDCNSPSFPSELACCKGAYAGQISGACLASLPSPPTMSPTETGGLDVYYPDYKTAWPEAGCINDRPLPSGRPTYGSMLACCKGAYRGQVSGKCLSMLPNPPTSSPTTVGFEADFWYPDYGTAWSEAGCSNRLPLPFNNPNDRPQYATQLECCKAAYAGQMSGACLSQLPSPPTTSPTGVGGLDVYYPDYDTAWSEAGCINKSPLPSGRPTYATMLECCKGAYAGQMSGACLEGLPNPPTTSPTGVGGLDVYYPDYDTPWSEAACINDGPLPSGRPTYSTMLECCKGAYGGQVSGACLAALPSPPTSSPTDEAGVGALWYPDYSSAWSEATCLNAIPLPFTPNSRPTYDSLLECCKAAYGGQQSGVCLASLPSPPTSSPTGAAVIAGELDGIVYPDYTKAFPEGVCINDAPLPSGRPSYTSKETCCAGAYAGQVSKVCMCDAVGVCFSCECGTQQERDDAGCNLTCS